MPSILQALLDQTRTKLWIAPVDWLDFRGTQGSADAHAIPSLLHQCERRQLVTLPVRSVLYLHFGGPIHH